MSLRPSSTAVPSPRRSGDGAARLNELLALNLVRQPADTECGSYGSKWGTIGMPCGCIVSYGTPGAETTGYVITTKTLSALDPGGTMLYKVNPEEMTSDMKAVQMAMNTMTRLMYRNAYGFKGDMSVKHLQIVQSMDAKHFPHTTGNTGKMFQAVHDVLKATYPEGYRFTTFRKLH